MIYSEGDVREWIEQYMHPKRKEHALRTADRVEELARWWGLSVCTGRTAALVHDICRDWSWDAMVQEAQKRNLPLSELEEHYPVLLHGPLAACLYEAHFGADKCVYDAVYYHTTGRPGMGPLEKCLFLADATEEGRRYQGIDDLRTLAFRDLDAAVLASVDRAIPYLVKRSLPLHPLTVNLRNTLLIEHRK